jgi:hypothetical protein
LAFSDHSAVEFIEPLRQYFRKKGVEAENLVFLVSGPKPLSEENYLLSQQRNQWSGYALMTILNPSLA